MPQQTRRPLPVLWRTASSFAAHRGEAIAFQHEHVVVWLGKAEAAVEFYRPFIGGVHCKPHVAGVASTRAFAHSRKQPPTDTRAAQMLLHKQILHVHAGAAAPGGEFIEIGGKTN